MGTPTFSPVRRRFCGEPAAQHERGRAAPLAILSRLSVKLTDVSDAVSQNYVFRGLEYESLERLHVEVGAQIRATSVIDSERGRYSYELVCEPDWTFRVIRIEAAAGERALTIESDGRGEWTVDGEWRSDLDDCIDIDLSVTPFTNTLPIRRLALALDDEADLPVAYVTFPDLEVTVDAQRYTRLAPRSYRYESLDTDLEADLTVDDDGVVLEYPGSFERL